VISGGAGVDFEESPIPERDTSVPTAGVSTPARESVDQVVETAAETCREVLRNSLPHMRKLDEFLSVLDP
jgi:hypothetical protein